MHKGIIMSGGAGTRLYPATKVIGKQLLTIYDKPMIYYSLSILMLAGIREILLISTQQDIPRYKELFQDGRELGLKIHYKVQNKPAGIVEAFLIGEDFLENSPVALILGDNIFYGTGLSSILRQAKIQKYGATIFIYPVHDPERYGVIELDKAGRPIAIYEKPETYISEYAITGFYLYDNNVVKYSKMLKPSKRGELEITDLNRIYLERGELNVQLLGRGMAWLDTGTTDSLLDAAQYISIIEKRQGLKIACIEEIAWRNQWIDTDQLKKLGLKNKNSSYGQYILNLVESQCKIEILKKNQEINNIQKFELEIN